ncbi:MAG: class III signal peptide-containing protein [Candidatus Micrarchaeia archaeon]
MLEQIRKVKKMGFAPRKGQGAFEYILLLAGILLIVVIVIIVLKSGLTQQSSTNIGESSEKIRVNAAVRCLDFCGDGAWAWAKSANSSITLQYNSSCPIAAGLNGTPNCFWTGSDNAVGCNATWSTGSSVYANTPPNNAKFCQLAQQSSSS